MQAYKVVKVVSEGSTVQLDALPFAAGEVVEIIVLAHQEVKDSMKPDPLTGSVLEYNEPFKPVAQDDWNALQ